MKRIICIILSLAMTLAFVGCGKKDKKAPESDKNTAIENSNEQDKDITKDNSSTSTEDNESPKNEESENISPDDETKSNDDSQPDVEATPEVPAPEPEPTPTPTPEPTPAPDTTERVFNIVSKNINDEIISGGEVRTVGLGVAENLREILSTVSSQYFEGTSLELTTIETINDKKIAVINLGGNNDFWYQRMQGSSGGLTTQYTLVENVLQRQYEGYWIDGVRFTLGGQSVVNNDHCPALSQTTYR